MPLSASREQLGEVDDVPARGRVVDVLGNDSSGIHVAWVVGPSLPVER